ncbi:MAG TPA: S41 family peptidase [Candidatus Limnocylindrales bacterium]|nr:S41 family peptidase [Candidatus Limnocylindrales bacterium]
MRLSRGHVTRIFGTALLVIMLLTAGFLMGSLHSVTSAQGDTQSSDPNIADVVSEVYNLMRSEYIDPIDAEKALDGALSGLMGSLNDPFSSYMNPESFARTNEEMQGQIQGIGVVIRTNEDTGAIEVVSVLEGSPAQAAGVHSGDIFHAINGELATEMTQDDLASKVRGPEGTDISITFARGDELIDMIITRSRITIPNVESRIVGNNIAYIKLNQFSTDARADIDRALEELSVNERDGLVFDMRDNPGGLLSSAIDVASAFIPSGPVVTEWFSEDHQQVFEATGDYAGITVPIAVLVNEGSASGSELVAGAIQDTGVAMLIGERTFGKGTVQTWHELSNGGGVRLTIARWITPGGRWIHHRGIVPNTLVMWNPTDYDDANDPQLDAAIQFLLNQQTPDEDVAAASTN